MKQHIVNMFGLYHCKMAGGSLPSQSPKYDAVAFSYKNNEHFKDHCINCGKKLIVLNPQDRFDQLHNTLK